MLGMSGPAENVHRVSHVSPAGPYRSVRPDRDIRVVANETGLEVSGHGKVCEPTSVRRDACPGIDALGGEAARAKVVGRRQRVAVDAGLTSGSGPGAVHGPDAHPSVGTDRGPGKDLVGPAALHARWRRPPRATVNRRRLHDLRASRSYR